jgi:hypothetical protein
MADVTIDNRGLQPPEPLVRILGALAACKDDDQLVALMDREPLLLYPELERRGWSWAFGDAAEDYGFVLRVFRPASR